MKAQWVCRVCGHNMIGRRPDVCPFCGEPHDVFLTWQEAEAGLGDPVVLSSERAGPCARAGRR